MDYKNRSVEFIGRTIDDGDFIFIELKQDGKVIHSKFAPFNLDCPTAIVRWMIYGEVFITELPINHSAGL